MVPIRPNPDVGIILLQSACRQWRVIGHQARHGLDIEGGARQSQLVAECPGLIGEAPRAAFNLGVLEAGAGNLDAARTAWQLVVDSGSADLAPRAAVSLGRLEAAAGAGGAARTAWQVAIDSGHADLAPRAAVNLGVLEHEVGNLDAARPYVPTHWHYE